MHLSRTSHGNGNLKPVWNSRQRRDKHYFCPQPCISSNTRVHLLTPNMSAITTCLCRMVLLRPFRTTSPDSMTTFRTLFTAANTVLTRSLRRPQLPLAAISTWTPTSVQSLEQIRGMKVRSSVKKLCDGCKVCLPYNWFTMKQEDVGGKSFHPKGRTKLERADLKWARD